MSPPPPAPGRIFSHGRLAARLARPAVFCALQSARIMMRASGSGQPGGATAGHWHANAGRGLRPGGGSRRTIRPGRPLESLPVAITNLLNLASFCAKPSCQLNYLENFSIRIGGFSFGSIERRWAWPWFFVLVAFAACCALANVVCKAASDGHGTVCAKDGRVVMLPTAMRGGDLELTTQGTWVAAGSGVVHLRGYTHPWARRATPTGGSRRLCGRAPRRCLLHDF